MKSRWVNVLLGLGVSLAGAAHAEDWHDGYVLGSRVNIRAAPDTSAERVLASTVGTPVRWRAADGDWCEIAPPFPAAGPGFVLCGLLTEEQPTLEAIDAELARADLTEQEEIDLLARRFYLSPSLKTLASVRSRLGMPWADDPADAPPDDGLFPALMEAFLGELTGRDFRPVDLDVNGTVVTDPAELAPREGKADELPPLPPARASLFRRPDDVLVAGRVWRSGEGRRASAGSDWRSADMIEFSKLYPRQRLNVRRSDAVGKYYGTWHHVAGVEVDFAVPPQALVIWRNRAVAAEIERADVHVDSCGDSQVVEAVLAEPVYSEGILVALAPGIRSTSVERLGDTANPAFYDLNGDGIADFVSLRFSAEGDDVHYGGFDFVLVNINGSWRLAHRGGGECL